LREIHVGNGGLKRVLPRRNVLSEETHRQEDGRSEGASCGRSTNRGEAELAALIEPRRAWLAPNSSTESQQKARTKVLEVEEFAQALGLLARDGNFGLFLVVHFDHEAGFEPRNDFLDVVDVDEIRAVGAPE
jgi:hypothetical protein